MKKPTRKQKDFAKEFVLGEEPGNGTKAALAAYNVKSKINASNVAAANLKKPTVQKEIQDLMEQHNLTDDFLFQRMKEGLDANIVSEFKGDVVETSTPDLHTRHRYLQDLIKVKGLYAPERNENINLNIASELENKSEEDLKQILKELLNEQKTANRINQESKAGQGA